MGIQAGIYPLADRIYGGKLAARLRAWRGEGLSFDSISFALRLEGITVSGETVRTWCRELEIDVAA